jgi:two-component system NtrC family sensor kinase
VRVELAPLLREVVSLLEPLANKESVSLAVHAPEAPIVVAADAGRLQQVFTNLVVNGLHAMKGRPGPLDVRLARVMRAVPGEPGTPRKAFAAVTFEDHGAGIAEEHLDRIFEPFFTTKDVGEGTGLGLSVSLGIVEEHGGAIDVTSELSVGTKFTVVLPIAEAEEARPS